MKRILSLMRAAVDKYAMIAQGDRIAVGVSGGKDSMVLLAGLARLRKFYPEAFEIVAVTLDYQFNGVPTDYTEIIKFCQTEQIEFHIRQTNLWEVIFETRKEKNPCALCSKMRRGILHDTAKSLGCNKIALGHHLDDAAETFFINLLQGGTLGCFSPVSYLSNKQLTMIRPLVFAYEKEVAACAKRQNLPVVESGCPVDRQTKREEIKQLLVQLEKAYPSTRKKIIGALERSGLDGW